MALITIPKVLRDKLGDEASEAFVTLVKEINLNSRKDALALAEERFEKRLSIESSKINERLTFEIGKVREDLAKLEGRLNERITMVEGRLNERLTFEIGKVNECITSLEGKVITLRSEIKLYFLILLFVFVLLSPNALELFGKLLGLVK
jgi:hypothetical protein